MAINFFHSPIKSFFSKTPQPRQEYSFEMDDLDLIKKYREFDTYQLDVEVYPETKIHIPKKLPSEPENGITYIFGQAGYIGEANSQYCVLPTPWRNINNYCHWIFSELPVLHLAFSSTAKNILLAASFLDVNLPFQMRWLEILKKKYPDKIIQPILKQQYTDILIPVNHDTSCSEELIGKCAYKHYHHSRASPYAIRIVDEMKVYFDTLKDLKTKRFYINRTSRRLKNELEVQSYLISLGYVIVNLEGLTLDDQVNLFMNAEEIIGFHGAGLANLLFCNTNGLTKVFEIVDKDCVHPSFIDGVIIPGVRAPKTYFHMLAHMKNIAYEVIESDDYFLDIQKLETVITRNG